MRLCSFLPAIFKNFFDVAYRLQFFHNFEPLDRDKPCYEEAQTRRPYAALGCRIMVFRAITRRVFVS